MSNRFGSQIDVIVFDIGFHIVPKSGLVIFSDNKLLSVFDSKMTNKLLIIMLANELCLDDFWYEREALMI